MFFRRAIRRFFADDRGNVAIICAVAFLPILVIAGGATDIARHEAYRVQLQDGVDRAVLAAASLTQTRPIEETARDYLSTLSFSDDIELTFTHSQTPTLREVRLVAAYEMETAFLPLIGINSITVGASAKAVERRKNIEISLILDISGSMREGGTPNRLARMKPAANGFIDAILTSTTAAYTSVSLVPYAGSVNPGAVVMDAMGVPRQHSYSSCMEFVNTDYAIGLVPFAQRTQVPHFTYNHQGVSYPGLEWSWCPLEATSITYLSNDAAALKTRITNLKMHDGTGTAIAMKWGMMLLEPTAQPLVAQGAANGYVPAAFANRPAAFSDTNTLKFIVLMTDGNVSDQYRPKQYAYPRACNAATNGSSSSACTTIVQTASDAVTRMYAVCDRAKANGVTVFTIGFDLGSSGRTQMRNCASSASHYYDVSATGIDIATAFQSIASAIQKIKLTE